MIDIKLLQKYNVPVPRYTSYPTVPYWKEHIDTNEWEKAFRKQFIKGNAAEGISLYLHLPFCESLCTYCGCNKKITTNHSVENVYMDAILKEWHMYTKLMEQKPRLRELHLGGGTPTFFSPKHLKQLLTTILEDCDLMLGHDFSIEGHPNNTTIWHLQTLYDLGFRRISYGVQDNNPEVQYVINRIQPFENVKRATQQARAIGFTSVNFDLIYGLPLQNVPRITNTIEQCITLKPDRVAFYSYAHVPWTSKAQRLFDEHDLPSAEEKMELYLTGKKLFTAAGYSDIGMDHFALPHDDLYKTWKSNSLHRNFMGYTTQKTSILLGLGVSAISDIGNAFAQNIKTLHDYYTLVEQNTIPVQKGYFLNSEDIAFRKYILDISCQGRAIFATEHLSILEKYTFPQLQDLATDGLVIYNKSGLQVTELGQHFIRNICKAFDLHLLGNGTVDSTFSKAI